MLSFILLIKVLEVILLQMNAKNQISFCNIYLHLLIVKKVLYM